VSKFTALLAVFACFFLAACSRTAPSNTPSNVSTDSPEGRRIASVDVVKVTPEEITISPGSSADARIRLTIDKGFHVNANPPTFAYLKATEIEVKPGPGISVSFVRYPNPLTRTFEFADKPLAVYEGETLITVQLKADPKATSGRTNLAATLRVQACDEKVCYAPGTKDVSIPVVVQ
jgi:thioredoxin:protein disulfide reductase